MKKVVTVEVYSGKAGDTLVLSNPNGGFRVKGPKLNAGGVLKHSFTVDLNMLVEAAKEESFDED